MTKPIAVDSRGNELLSYVLGPESDLDTTDSSVPLPLALVVAQDGGQCLLVFNRWRQMWELPGGMLDDRESALEAGTREFTEETGLAPLRLHFAGVALFRLAPDARRERAAIFRAVLDASARDQLSSFAGNDEIEQVCWWTPGSALPDLAALDAELASRTMASAGAGSRSRAHPRAL